MIYAPILTSKGQMTIPAYFRKKLDVRPGERVLVKLQGDKVIIQKSNWKQNLRALQARNRSYLEKHGIKPLSDGELDKEINKASQAAAIDRYQRSQES